jgi:hypothetical protein
VEAGDVTKNMAQGSWYPGRASKPGPLKYKAEMPLCFVR